MSEKKSWDIQPKKKGAAAEPPRPIAPRREAPRILRGEVTVARPTRRATHAAGTRQTVSTGGESLKMRRRAARRRILVILTTLIVIALLGAIWGAWQPFVRVSYVQATGIHADAIPHIAAEALTGNRLLVFPKNSIFLAPEEPVRVAILNTYPDIAAVSIHADSFHSLSVETIPRVAAFLWCGTDPLVQAHCFEADAEGFVFKEVGMNQTFLAAAPEPVSQTQTAAILTTASSTSETTDAANNDAVSSFRIYAPLVEGEQVNSLRAHVSESFYVPAALKLARTLRMLHADVHSLVLRDEEGDFYTAGGTRITYVLGQEDAAALTAATAFPNLSLNDGSVSYVDLRFPNKAYYKKVESEK